PELVEGPAGARITDYISLGVIAKTVPLTTVRSVLAASGKASLRERDLPAHVVMYSVIALALFLQASYREVPRCLLEGLQGLRDPAMPLKVAGKSGISQARTRLGWDALRQLHDAVGRSPCLPPGAPGIARGAWSASTAARWMSPTKRRTRRPLAGPAAAARTAPIRRSALCLWSRTARMSCSAALWRAVKPARVRWRGRCWPACKEACWAWPTASSSALRAVFHHAVLDEILQERVVSSRNRRNPRGVKRKMSNFPIRRKTDRSLPAINIAETIQIAK
ncbi:MAG: transposase domain-containing protein, partial [Stellaceae bacterium]